MHIYGAKFQEHCFNISRDIVYSVFYHFLLQTIRRHHWSNLHNRKTSISLKRKKMFQKEKHHSCVFWKVFQISRIYFSCHMHFKIKECADKVLFLIYQWMFWPNFTESRQFYKILLIHLKKRGSLKKEVQDLNLSLLLRGITCNSKSRQPMKQQNP